MSFLTIIAMIFLILLVVIAWFSTALAKAWRRNEVIRAELIDSFYDRASQILKHSDTTPEISAFVTRLGDAMANPTFIRSFAFRWLRGALRDVVPSPRVRELQKNLASCPEDLRKLVNEVIALSIFASTYSTFFWGWLVRRLLLKPIGMPKQTNDSPQFVEAFLWRNERSDEFPHKMAAA